MLGAKELEELSHSRVSRAVDNSIPVFSYSVAAGKTGVKAVPPPVSEVDSHKEQD